MLCRVSVETLVGDSERAVAVAVEVRMLIALYVVMMMMMKGEGRWQARRNLGGNMQRRYNRGTGGSLRAGQEGWVVRSSCVSLPLVLGFQAKTTALAALRGMHHAGA